MLRILGTIFAALLGLCFGSFLNVCLSRWPEGESIVHPRSHCRACARTLAWWENIPLVSWIALRGRCRGCGTWIGVRYPVVEVTVGALWAIATWQSGGDSFQRFIGTTYPGAGIALLLLRLTFLWLLVALSVLDAENLWLPDKLTIPGTLLGFVEVALGYALASRFFLISRGPLLGALIWVGGALAAAAIILLTRWLYWLVRRREGLGLGDAKLMAMLAAWLGLPLALLSLFIGVVLGAVVAVAALLRGSGRGEGSWATLQLPLGTFLCIGGIVSALWGGKILAAYLGLFP
jgi:leader peptidase (prepilin peptidase) / N-methyltransferase